MFRGEVMCCCDIYLQPDIAFEVMTVLGDMECAEFIDMTPDIDPSERTYISELSRYFEMERQMLLIEREMKKIEIEIPDLDTKATTLQPKDMSDLESKLLQLEKDVSDMADNQYRMTNNYLEMTEMLYVLQYVGPLVGVRVIEPSQTFERTDKPDLESSGRLYVTTGLISRKRSFPFQRVLWRLSRGNIYIEVASNDLVEKSPVTGFDIRKVGFIIVCQGANLQAQVKKVCDGFGACLYEIPRNINERLKMTYDLNNRIKDLARVMKPSIFYRCKYLRDISKEWSTWMAQIQKSTAVYYTMSLFTLDITKGCLIGQCWVAENDIPKIVKSIDKISIASQSNLASFIIKTDTLATPPSFVRKNKFTQGFQTMIDAFSESQYREINPGLFAVITFPFLFAVMFGDVCHGIILAAFAGWMVAFEKKYMEKKSSSEVWNIFFEGRYVILLMGLFSIYTGFIYNSFFAKAISIHATHWRNHYSIKDIEENEQLTLNPSKQVSGFYEVGVDPIWLAKGQPPEEKVK